jgi:hypothetical protein
MPGLAALGTAWRDRAGLLDRHGATEAAASCRACADDLEAALQAAEAEELTLSEAVEASGYSDRALRAKLADGTIPNAGRPGAPRIRRADLPRRSKPASRSAYDPDADAAQLLGRLRTS